MKNSDENKNIYKDILIKENHYKEDNNTYTNEVITDFLSNDTFNEEIDVNSIKDNSFENIDILNVDDRLKLDTIDFYLNSISKYGLISENEIKVLSDKIQQGDNDALHKLVESNLRLSFKIAKKYANFSNIPLEELIQVANYGLLYSCKIYTSDCNCKFTTFISTYINSFLWNFINKENNQMTISIREIIKINDIRKSFFKLKKAYGKNPSSLDIFSDLNGKYSLKQIDKCNINDFSYLEIDKETEDGTTILELISDPEDLSVVDSINYVTDISLIRKELESLSVKEKYILTKHYGLDDLEPQTLEEIGKELNLTKERVRQIEKETLHKIREKIGIFE